MGATSFIKQPKEIAFVDSPQYVKIKDTGNVTAATSIAVSLYIWNGLIGISPAFAQYTLNLPAIITTGIETETWFEISKFIKEYIATNKYVSDGGAQYNEDAAVWFTVNVEADNGNLPEISLPKLGVSGYGYFEDGTNPGTTVAAENGKVFGNQSSKLIYADSSDYLIPVYVGSTSTNNEIDSNFGDLEFVADLGFVLNSVDSSKQIAYINIGTSAYGANWAVDNQVNYEINDIATTSSQGTYTAYIDCIRGNPMSLKYLNSYGAISELPVNGKEEVTFGIKRTTYNNNPLDSDLDYDPTNHVKKTFDVNGTRIINVTTGWIYEETNIMIQELLLSKSIWLEYGAITYPVNIRDNAKKILNRNWNSQVGYDFTLEVSSPLINQVL